MKDPQLRNNPPNPAPAETDYKSLGAYDSQLHLYDREQPDVHTVWREFRSLLDSFSEPQPRAAFGEIHVFDWPKWAAYYGQQLDGLHMPFNLGLIGVDWRPRSMRRVADSIEAAIPPGAWPNYMLANFDESRIASRYGAEEARVAAMLLLTLRGTPTLCYGEEIGLTNVPIPPELEQDPFGLRVPGLGRDPFRTPMQWNSGPHAGFSAPETPRLWLPLAPNYAKNNVECQLAETTSILNLYRRLIAYRKDSPALLWGDYRPVDEGAESCYVHFRQAGEQHLLIALNFSGREEQISLPELAESQITISTYLDRIGPVEPAGLKLRAHEGVIVELRRK